MLVQSRSMQVAAVLAVLAAATANAALARSTTVEPPATPVGAQVAWLLEVSSRLPISEAEADEHFSPAFLAVVPLAEINAVFTAIAGPTGLTLIRYEGGDTTARTLVSGAGVWLGFVGLDPEGRIGALSVEPVLALTGDLGGTGRSPGRRSPADRAARGEDH